MTFRTDGAPSLGGRPHDGILISGAGAVGLALGLALAGRGWAVTVLGPRDARRNGRTVALFEGSVRLMEAIGVWPRLQRAAAPLATMRIVDATDSLFRAPPVAFAAAEIGLPAFGANVDNAALTEALEEAAAAAPGLRRVEGRFGATRLEGETRLVTDEAGATHRAALLAAADGAASPAREALGISARIDAYPQEAVTVLLTHTAPHENVSTEFHTRQGPFTLVPLVPRPEAPHRSSLVWVMAPAEAARRTALPPEALAREIERQSRGLLGAVRIEGPAGRFPLRLVAADRLAAPRAVLVGEAAHALPPIGAQGLNLSLRDAATLADVLGPGGPAAADPGAPGPLDRYARLRAGDIALRAGAVNALNRALLAPPGPADLLRGAGLAMLAAVPGARRALMRQGLMPRHAVPSLMRERALDAGGAPRHATLLPRPAAEPS